MLACGWLLFLSEKGGVSKIGQGLGLWPSVGESGSGRGEGRLDTSGMGRQAAPADDTSFVLGSGLHIRYRDLTEPSLVLLRKALGSPNYRGGN